MCALPQNIPKPTSRIQFRSNFMAWNHWNHRAGILSLANQLVETTRIYPNWFVCGILTVPPFYIIWPSSKQIFRYWRNDGRIKGTLSTNGGFSFIYILYMYMYMHISIFIPTDSEFSRSPSPTPASPRAPSSSVPDSKMSIRALVVMIQWWLHPPIPGDIWRYSASICGLEYGYKVVPHS